MNDRTLEEIERLLATLKSPKQKGPVYSTKDQPAMEKKVSTRMIRNGEIKLIRRGFPPRLFKTTFYDTIQHRITRYRGINTTGYHGGAAL
jgi:hypothetical protein